MTFLHTIGDLLRVQLEQVPLNVAKWLMIGLFLVMLFWIIQVPTRKATPADRQSFWYQDLRIWAWLTLMIQVVIYGVF